MTHREQARLLGLDVGRKTIGVAVSDPLGLFAQAVEVWRRAGPTEDILHLRELADRYEAEGIVVGLPLRTDGTAGPEADSVRVFARKVEEALKIPVILWDERFSTKEAERLLIDAGLRRDKRRSVVDKTAAAIILQGFLDRRGSANARI